MADAKIKTAIQNFFTAARAKRDGLLQESSNSISPHRSITAFKNISKVYSTEIKAIGECAWESIKNLFEKQEIVFSEEEANEIGGLVKDLVEQETERLRRDFNSRFNRFPMPPELKNKILATITSSGRNFFPVIDAEIISYTSIKSDKKLSSATLSPKIHFFGANMLEESKSTKYKIIHISDLHFSSSKEKTKVDDRSEILTEDDHKGYSNFDLFKEHLEKINDDSIKILAITGDLTVKTSEQGFKKSIDFINDCGEILGIKDDAIIISPGNHDIERSINNNEQIELFKKYTERFCTPFAKKIYLDKGECLLFPFNSNNIKEGRVKKRFIRKDLKELIVTAQVGVDQLSEMKEAVIKNKKKIRIALLHHHIVPVWGIETKEYDPILDAGNVLKELQKNGFSVVLHGHKHGNSSKFIQELENDNQQSGLFVLGVNSLHTEGSFNIIDIIDSLNSTTITKTTYSISDGHVRKLGEAINCTPKSIVELKDKPISVEINIDGE